MSRSHALLCLTSAAALACAGMPEAFGSVLNSALAPPAFSENFEAPVSGNYTAVRAGQSFTTQAHTWSVTSGSVDVVNASVRRELTAFDGNQAIDLAGSPGAGVMSASFATTPGQSYALTFHYARNNGIGAQPARARIEVKGASTLLRAEVQHAAPTAFNAYQRFSQTFVADSTSTTLRFSSLVGGNCGIALDAISVSGAGAAAVARVRNLSGEYVYLQRGVCTISQAGVDVSMLCTWTPIANGPHYQVRGKLAGNTISGEWYSLYAKKGWYRYVGQVGADGSIDQAKSDDPIRSNIKTAVLTKKR